MTINRCYLRHSSVDKIAHRNFTVLSIEQMKNDKPLVSHIEEQLRKEIIEGALRPQERIIEAEIAKRFKVSRSPVREAFRIFFPKKVFGSKRLRITI